MYKSRDRLSWTSLIFHGGRSQSVSFCAALLGWLLSHCPKWPPELQLSCPNSNKQEGQRWKKGMLLLLKGTSTKGRLLRYCPEPHQMAMYLAKTQCLLWKKETGGKPESLLQYVKDFYDLGNALSAKKYSCNIAIGQLIDFHPFTKYLLNSCWRCNTIADIPYMSS